MGKWAKYSIYDGRGDLLMTFQGMKVKKMKPAPGKTPMGFGPVRDLTDAVAPTSPSAEIKVECDCDETHEEHIQL